MDRFNNRLGREIGTRVLHDQACATECRMAVENGGLMCLSPEDAANVGF